MLTNLTTSTTPLGSSTEVAEPTGKYFFYFAYGSCMCPVDLKRSLREDTHPYVIGPARLQGYRLGFHYYSPHRQCGALDLLPECSSEVQGVLYRLPWRLSNRLDQREGVAQGGYRHEQVTVYREEHTYQPVRTYLAVQKTASEVPPNDWYLNVVMRGATINKLPEQYCWQLYQHMHRLQLAYA